MIAAKPGQTLGKAHYAGGCEMTEKTPENRAKPSRLETKPPEKKDPVKALGEMAIKNSGRK